MLLLVYAVEGTLLTVRTQYFPSSFRKLMKPFMFWIDVTKAIDVQYGRSYITSDIMTFTTCISLISLPPLFLYHKEIIEIFFQLSFPRLQHLIDQLFSHNICLVSVIPIVSSVDLDRHNFPF